MSTTSPISIEQLHSEYDHKRERCRAYARANMIFDLSDADQYYLKLLIERSEAELNYREAMGEFIHIPRIEKQLSSYKEMLDTGVIL